MGALTYEHKESAAPTISPTGLVQPLTYYDEDYAKMHSFKCTLACALKISYEVPVRRRI